MERPPTYQELVTTITTTNNRNRELEIQVQDLKQQLYYIKEKLEKVNIAYTRAKKNEVLLTSVLQSKI
jgi:hypothetical protein